MEHYKNMSLVNITIDIDGEKIIEKWTHCKVYLQNGNKEDYTGYYMISSFGRVKSLGRKINFINRWGQPCVRVTKDKILKPNITNQGYLRQTLTKGGDKEIGYSIHRLVLSSFKGNPKKLPQINHEDGVKTNNYIKNLKWCTQEYNQQHAYETGLNVPKRGWEDNQSYPVRMIYPNGNTSREFGSMCEAERITGIGRTSIKRCCQQNKAIQSGKHKGYKFNFL